MMHHPAVDRHQPESPTKTPHIVAADLYPPAAGRGRHVAFTGPCPHCGGRHVHFFAEAVHLGRRRAGCRLGSYTVRVARLYRAPEVAA